MISDDEIKAIQCLAGGTMLVDPKHTAAHLQMEEKLKDRCRVCWHLRHAFPKWVVAYIDRWKSAKPDPSALPQTGLREAIDGNGLASEADHTTYQSIVP